MERFFFHNSCITNEDIDKYYDKPCLDLQTYEKYMSDEKQLVLGSVKINKIGVEYIEIIFINSNCADNNSYLRFIIQRGFIMSEQDEREYLSILHGKKDIVMLPGRFNDFQKEARSFLQGEGIFVQNFDEDDIKIYLDYIYSVSHRSGAKEILYKAFYNRIAFGLRDYKNYNIVGRSPQDILGVSLKLIKILYELQLEERLMSEYQRVYLDKLYRKYSAYLGRIINEYQWYYLEDFGDGEQFDKNIFKRLSKCESEETYDNVRWYIMLSSELGNYSPYKRMPSLSNLNKAVEKMRLIEENIDPMGAIGTYLASRTDVDWYTFSDEEFIIYAPHTIGEIVEEANHQNSCLVEYISDLDGDSVILFMRELKNKDKPYITIEVSGDYCIEQARSRFNGRPSERDFEFLQAFSNSTNIGFDYDYLTSDFYGEDEAEDTNVWEYISEFNRLIYPHALVD